MFSKIYIEQSPTFFMFKTENPKIFFEMGHVPFLNNVDFSEIAIEKAHRALKTGLAIYNPECMVIVGQLDKIQHFDINSKYPYSQAIAELLD